MVETSSEREQSQVHPGDILKWILVAGVAGVVGYTAYRYYQLLSSNPFSDFFGNFFSNPFGTENLNKFQQEATKKTSFAVAQANKTAGSVSKAIDYPNIFRPIFYNPLTGEATKGPAFTPYAPVPNQFTSFHDPGYYGSNP